MIWKLLEIKTADYEIIKSRYSFLSFSAAKRKKQRKAHHENQPQVLFYPQRPYAISPQNLRFALFVDIHRTATNFFLCRKQYYETAREDCSNAMPRCLWGAIVWAWIFVSFFSRKKKEDKFNISNTYEEYSHRLLLNYLRVHVLVLVFWSEQNDLAFFLVVLISEL